MTGNSYYMIFLPHFSNECMVLTQKYKISGGDGQWFTGRDINRYFDESCG